jgi:hypothetical protein
MLTRVKQILQLWRYLGFSWLTFRTAYELRLRTGMMARKLPAYQWAERPLSYWLKDGVPADPQDYVDWRHQQADRFFFNETITLPQVTPWNPEDVVGVADDALQGRWQYFSKSLCEVGFPPDWHYNLLTEQQTAADRHWSQIDDFDSGDIKLIWEASRFSVVYSLVRAYIATGNEDYPAAFWSLVEDWAQQNPPQLGPNWKCGQETSFRIMAWCFGLYGFSRSSHSSPQRIANLAAMVAASAERVEGNIAYARSQGNNHAISEGLGLWTVGILFPEFRMAEHWRKHGRRVLVEEVFKQVDDDGSYAQHSTNYHRVMLHDCIWALRLGEINEARLPPETYERIGWAIDFLYHLTDLESGQVPNFGGNDGALILPLNNCDYTDFRPVLQAGHYLIHKDHLFAPGPWDEDLFWLFGDSALQNHSPESVQADGRHLPGNLVAETGGYYTMRGTNSWAMVRCARYKTRPHHADQLHFDLWWHGVNVACDAGSYLYNGAPPWDDGLSYTAVHNTVMVDNQDQMTRLGHFIWLDWSTGMVNQIVRSESGHLEYWEGQHDGYARLSAPVIHRRGILHLGDEHWLVLDELSSSQTHAYRLHWLFPDLNYQWDDSGSLTLQTHAGPYHAQMALLSGDGQYSLVREDAVSTRGWRSRSYMQKEPALSVALEAQADSTRFWTVFSPSKCSVETSQNNFQIQTQNWKALIQLNSTDGTPLVQTVQSSGIIDDTLKVLES